MIRWLLILPVAVLIAACGGDEGTAPELADDPVVLPPTGASGQAIVRDLPERTTSRRFDLQVTVVDSAGGVDHVEIWARPDGGDWDLALTVADTLPVRFTVPEEGPFGGWEFMALAVAAGGAREAMPELAEAATVVPEPIVLTDRQGERWEVTNAVLGHGMGLHSWEFGLGRQAIQAIVDPAMACDGDPDYPDPENLAVVIGVAAGDEARAYRVGDLNDREVVDDAVGDAHVAVTY